MSLDNEMNENGREEEKISDKEFKWMSDIEKACYRADEMSPDKYKEELDRLRKKEARHTSILAIGMLMVLTMCIVLCVLFITRISYVKKLQNQIKELTTTSEENTDSFEKLVEKLSNLDNYTNAYYLFDKDYVKISEAVYKAYFEALDDQYTEYYNAEEYAALNQYASASYAGIGATVSLDEETGYVLIKEFLNGSDAPNRGLEIGDMITAVEGEKVAGKKLAEATTLLKGVVGTDVNLSIYRPSTDEYFDVTITRMKIDMVTVGGMMLDDGIGYIYITQFGEATAAQFKEKLNAFLDEGMKALVVDVRENPGGMLTSVNEILDMLLPEGILVYTETKSGSRTEYKSDAECLNIPMAVLVDGNSASAAEIFAGAMKDYNWATLIGETTYGKGIVQTIHSMGDGSAIKLTISRYFTPSGVCIHGTGVSPDIELEYDKESAQSGEWKTDNQLYKAYEILLEELK